MAEAIPLWLQNFQRQTGIRRAIVLHGNVQDLAYEHASGDYIMVPELVAQTLRNGQFDHVVRWDRAKGMQGIPAELQSSLVADAAQTAEQPAAFGESYDMGAPLAPAQIPQACDPQDFFKIVEHHLRTERKQRIAFVIEWSQYLFGNATSLSEAERQWLLLLNAAVASPVEVGNENLGRPSSLVVFICSRSTAVPPIFIQNNPAVTDIVVPGPGRRDRDQFLRQTAKRWAVNAPLVPDTVPFNDFVDALDGLTLRDVQQLMKMSRQTGQERLTPEALCNLYKFGDRKSPWEELNHAKLKSLVEVIGQRVIGQGDAIQKINQVIIRAFTGLSGLQHSKKQRMPKGILFFVGPTGVGKTELAKALAGFLFGDDEACVRFDMSEFNHEHSDQRLIGAPPGYVGFEEGGQLTNAIKRRPFSVLLFDEIEKAHPRILDKFLQILEDGRLTDGKGETVSFAEAVIIFTSNIGAAEVALDPDPTRVKQAFLEKVRHHFVYEMKRPELLNRIGDNIVPFNFITGTDFLSRIAKSKLGTVRKRLVEKYGLRDLLFNDESAALEAIASQVDRSMGGRGVLNELVKRLIDPLAEFLFDFCDSPRYLEGKVVRVRQRHGSADFLFELEGQ